MYINIHCTKNMPGTQLFSLPNPEDIDPLLGTLLGPYKKSTTPYNTQTDINSTGCVTYYSAIPPRETRGNLVLIPGLASNTDTDPLMKNLRYWGFTHSYNIYCINTFMGDFVQDLSYERAQKNTFAEYVAAIGTSLDIVEEICAGQPTHIISHSIGGNALIKTFYNRAAENRDTNFSSVMMFAPCITGKWYRTLEQQHMRSVGSSKLEDIKKIPIPVYNPHNKQDPNSFVPIMHNFLTDSCDLSFERPFINRLQKPVTIVGGTHDRAVPSHQLQAIYKLLKTQSNSDLFQFMLFEGARHTFTALHNKSLAIKSLLKTLYNQPLTK